MEILVTTTKDVFMPTIKNENELGKICEIFENNEMCVDLNCSACVFDSLKFYRAFCGHDSTATEKKSKIKSPDAPLPLSESESMRDGFKEIGISGKLFTRKLVKSGYLIKYQDGKAKIRYRIVEEKCKGLFIEHGHGIRILRGGIEFFRVLKVRGKIDSKYFFTRA